MGKDVAKMIRVRTLCLIAIVALISSSFTLMSLKNVSYQAYTEEPPLKASTQVAETETYEHLNLTFDDESEVDDFLWRAHYTAGGKETNGSVVWNETMECVEFNGTRNMTGQFALGGFYPAQECSISFSIKFEDYGFNGAGISLIWYGCIISLTSYQSSIRCATPYYNSEGVYSAPYTSSPIWGIGNLRWIHVDIDWYANRTFHYSFTYDTGTISTGWRMAHMDYDYTDPPTPWPAMVVIAPATGSSAAYNTYYQWYLDNVTQSMDVSTGAYYADFSHTKYCAMGFDGPYNESFVNAFPVLQSIGGRATWYFNIGLKDINWTESDMALVLNGGHEFGIHAGENDWDESFVTYNASNIAEIESRFDELYALANGYGWNGSSISWTSLGNGYGWDFNDHIYDTYASVGRKIWNHWYTNQGGWIAEYNFTAGAAERGLPFSGYSHKIGDPADIPFNTWYDQVNDTITGGLSIVGLGEYWFRYSAPWFVDVTTDGVIFDVAYDDYSVWNDFEFTIDTEILGLTNRYLGLFDLTDATSVTDIDYDTDYAIFNASDEHQYALPLSASSSTNTTLNITRCSPILSFIEWTTTLTDDEEQVTYYLRGLDEEYTYLIYKDGYVILTATGPTITFSSTGDGEFEVIIWNTKTISSLTVLTVNMVGLGILVSVVFGWVVPFSKSIKKGEFRRTEQMTKELMKGVVFIVVGMFMYSMLWNVAIG